MNTEPITVPKDLTTEPWSVMQGLTVDPTEDDFNDPRFDAIWKAIKAWDLQRSPDQGYAHANGSDVMTILNAVRGVERELVLARAEES